MLMLVGMPMPDSQAAKVVPKLGLTRAEVEFSIGSPDVVKRMLAAGWLKPISKGPVLFDSGDVQRAWIRFIKNAGEVKA